MQIILLEKIVNLGNLGDVVRVRDGYARNYLIPQKKARRATEAALKEFEERRAEHERLQAERLAQAQSLATRLEGVVLTLTEKAGVDGRLFGSVTHMDIATALGSKGFEGIAKTQVRVVEGAVKSIGEYTAQLLLHPDVTAEISLKVEGDLV